MSPRYSLGCASEFSGRGRATEAHDTGVWARDMVRFPPACSELQRKRKPTFMPRSLGWKDRIGV